MPTTTVNESINTLVLSSVGMLTAFSITFAAAESFKILFDDFSRLKKLLILWLYAALVFAISVVLFMYLPDNDDHAAQMASNFEKRTAIKYNKKK